MPAAPSPTACCSPRGLSPTCKESDRWRYGGDWPYWTYGQFFYSYTEAQQPFNGNVPNTYGLTNFIGVRRSSALAQLNLQDIAPILSDFKMKPGLPRTNDAITVSIEARDDSAITNVSLVYSFDGGPTQTVKMALQTDGSFETNLPAFGAGGILRYHVRAFDDAGQSTTHPYGGEVYAASVDVDNPAYDLVVTELNYNPYDLTPAEIAAGLTDPDDLEFVELHNTGDTPMDITGFVLQDGIGAVFPAFTLTNGHYAVVVADTNAFRIRYPDPAIPIIGTYSGKLKNSGETIRLENTQGDILASIDFEDDGPWPGRADGDGSSLELIDPANPEYDEPSQWRSSSEYGGSPGAAGLGPDNRIVLNEVLAHTDDPQVDSIELFNTTAGALDIGGWYLSDAKSDYRKYLIPPTNLPAGGYMVFDAVNHFNASADTNKNFLLDGAHGDDVYLLETDAQTNLVRFVDHVDFGASANGESFGRWPNGTGGLAPMITNTFGAANSGPRTGPLFISELMYHPPSGSNHLEFIEIANPEDAPEDLTNWQLDDGVEFAFPAAASIPAGGTRLILSFDPAAPSNSALLASFRATYGLSTNIPLLGPYSGVLDNSGERIRLLRPDEPPLEEPDFTPLLIEDEVRYHDDLPWPVEPDGQGASLERLLPAAWGDDPASWTAANPPTPAETGEPVPTFDLTVASAHGSPVPSVGTHAYAENAGLSNSVPSPVTGGGIRYRCTGWTLAGHQPAAGTTNWMTMTLTNDADLTWLWDTNYSVSATADPGGSVSPGDSWHVPGATVDLTATASNDYVFAGWTGDTNAITAGDANSTSITVTVAVPVALTARFDAIVPTYYAAPGGSHTEPYTNWTLAATNLQSIVEYVPDDSTIRVAAATWSLSSQLSVGKSVHLIGEDGPAATRLDGGNSTRVLFLSHTGAVIEGFTIQNGNSGGSSGGGVRIEPDGQLVNCILRDNTSQRYGGGASLIVGSGVLRNCLVHGNTASYRGGGIYVFSGGGAPRIENCTITSNRVTDSELEEPRGGGGLNLYNATILRNCIVWGNTAPFSSNLVLFGTASTIEHTLSGPVQSGTGNLAGDPLFEDAGGDDFHPATGSPCINAGTNQPWMSGAVDLDGYDRILYGTNDMGAFEGLLDTVDSDEDTLGDWQEAQAGTDPFNSSSFLGIMDSAPAIGAGEFTMVWSSVAGRFYRITYTTNMTLPFNWVAFSNIPATPPTNTYTAEFPGVENAYYRIEVE